MILTFIADIVKALAWPTAIITLGILYRKSFSNLVEGVKLRQFKIRDWEANFDLVEKEVRAELSGTSSPVSGELDPLESESPDAAVLLKWKELESKVKEVASKESITKGSFHEILNELVRKGLIESTTRDSILGLRHLRNLAVHAPPGKLTTRQAQEFASMTTAATWSFDQNIKRVHEND